MKTKKLFLMAAMLLMSVCTFAQSETPLKGDVNGDGKVDVADIVAVIEIMKNNGGTTETTYYWYIGQTNPLTMNNISPIVTDKRSPGWRLIGTTLPTYNSSNKLWDGTQISTGTTKQTNYVALPNNTLFMYDAAGNRSSGSWLLVGETEIGGLTYYVYSSVANLKTFGFNIY